MATSKISSQTLQLGGQTCSLEASRSDFSFGGDATTSNNNRQIFKLTEEWPFTSRP